LISPSQKTKKVETIKAPQIEDSMERWSVSPFGPTYMGEKGRTLGKTQGIKARYYREHPWETHRKLNEHIGNKGKMKNMLEESAEASDLVGTTLRSSHPERTTNEQQLNPTHKMSTLSWVFSRATCF
jgi:hypothetical protein